MDHIRTDFQPVPFREKFYTDEHGGFHTFPARCGWTIDEEDRCCSESPTDGKQLEAFLQAWLFFGLLHATLGEDVLGKAPDCFRQFVDPNGPMPYITTKPLPGLLQAWTDREKDSAFGRNRNLRMIRIQMALDRAHAVVRRYFTVEGQSIDPEEEMDESLGLSLIILGEALSCTKNKIISQGSLTIQGWHSEAREGWGSSIAVINGMIEKGWCPRSIYVLRNQLQGNTTALHEAYMIRRSKQRTSHDNCTEVTCKVRTLDSNAEYKQQHRCQSGNCGTEGPNVADLVEIIRSGQIPVLELKDNMAVMVKAREHCEDYGTVTHVWSDGFGNPLRNDMPRCQLKFLAEAMGEAERQLKMRNHGRKLFWIDTLAIPVGAENKSERMTSIGQIHDVFINSKYTIVFDSELCAMKVGNRYVETAMNILASGWMQRLWTLQEAYLSKRLFFKFQDTALDLEILEELFPQTKEMSSSILPDAARSYFHSILGTARQARIHQMTPTDGVSLIASVWKAAHWRSTSRRQHEALAIATLLGLNSGSSTMASFLKEAYVTGDDEFNTAKYCESMKNLWALIHDVYPGSIPAGLIFLPPPRLTMKGFGWAPLSWLAGTTSDDLKPLFAQSQPTHLDQNGLLVEFPGFVLHCSSAAKSQLQLLSEGKSELCFPFGSNLLEWYQVRKVVGDEENGATLRSDEMTNYAIIIPQEQPRTIEEIGLFVKIRRAQLQRSLENSRTSSIFHVSVLFRVLVSRDMTENIEENKEQFFLDTNLILGELVDRSQKWYVDSYDTFLEDLPSRIYRY